VKVTELKPGEGILIAANGENHIVTYEEVAALLGLSTGDDDEDGEAVPSATDLFASTVKFAAGSLKKGVEVADLENRIIALAKLTSPEAVAERSKDIQKLVTKFGLKGLKQLIKS
jgi:hypothetical protein